MPELTLKELLDKNLSLSGEEWNAMSKASQKRILALIDSEKASQPEKRVLMTEKGREVVKDFLDLSRDEFAALNPNLRERLMEKITSLAQKAGVAG